MFILYTVGFNKEYFLKHIMYFHHTHPHTFPFSFYSFSFMMLSFHPEASTFLACHMCVCLYIDICMCIYVYICMQFNVSIKKQGPQMEENIILVILILVFFTFYNIVISH